MHTTLILSCTSCARSSGSVPPIHKASPSTDRSVGLVKRMQRLSSRSTALRALASCAVVAAALRRFRRWDSLRRKCAVHLRERFKFRQSRLPPTSLRCVGALAQALEVPPVSAAGNFVALAPVRFTRATRRAASVRLRKRLKFHQCRPLATSSRLHRCASLVQLVALRRCTCASA